jgi:hypothetical protein
MSDASCRDDGTGAGTRATGRRSRVLGNGRRVKWRHHPSTRADGRRSGPAGGLLEHLEATTGWVTRVSPSSSRPPCGRRGFPSRRRSGATPDARMRRLEMGAGGRSCVAEGLVAKACHGVVPLMGWQVEGWCMDPATNPGSHRTLAHVQARTAHFRAGDPARFATKARRPAATSMAALAAKVF